MASKRRIERCRRYRDSQYIKQQFSYSTPLARLDDSSISYPRLIPKLNSEQPITDAKATRLFFEPNIVSFTLAETTPNVAYTEFREFTFLGVHYTADSWTDFVVQIAKLVRKGKHGDLLDEVSPSDIEFTKRLCIASKPDGMIHPKQIDDTLWIETNFSANQLVDFAKWLTYWCDVEQSQVIVYCQRKKAPEPVTRTPDYIQCILDSYVDENGRPLPPSSLRFIKRFLCKHLRNKTTSSTRNQDADIVETPQQAEIYHFSNAKQHDEVKAEAIKSAANVQQIAFNRYDSISLNFTRPVLLQCGKVYYFVRHWREVLTTFVDMLASDPDYLARLRQGTQSLPFTKGVILAERADALHTAYRVRDDLYLEINRSSNTCLELAAELGRFVGLDYQKMACVAYYYRTENAGTNSISRRQHSEIRREVEVEVPKEVRDFLLDYTPDGVNLSPTGVQLLKANAPRKIRDYIDLRLLKQWLFCCGEDCWLLPEMVADADTLAKLRAKVSEVLEQYASYAVANLLAEFSSVLRHVALDLKDFAVFLCAGILPHDAEIIGQGKEMLCVSSSHLQEEVVYARLSEAIRGFLQEAGDAIPEEELLSNLPNINADILASLCREKLPEAISFEQEGVRCWKLLEFYWLPEDFSAQLAEMVPRMERDYSVATLPLFQQELQRIYGESFLEAYALTDDGVLRQIIQASWKGMPHTWKRNCLFVAVEAPETRKEKSKNTSVLKAFLQQQRGIFQEDDFIHYAQNVRGLKSPKAILTSVLLLPYCIRFSEHLWIFPDDFAEMGILSDALWQNIEERLVNYLGNNPFLPISELPRAFFDNLPSLKVGEETYYWNGFLLSSVAQFRIRRLQIVNTNVAPYSLTGLLIPQDAVIDLNDDNGVVDYCLRYWPRQNGIVYSAEDGFEFLKSRQVRLRKSKLLLSHLASWLKEHSHV